MNIVLWGHLTILWCISMDVEIYAKLMLQECRKKSDLWMCGINVSTVWKIKSVRCLRELNLISLHNKQKQMMDCPLSSNTK